MTTDRERADPGEGVPERAAPERANAAAQRVAEVPLGALDFGTYALVRPGPGGRRCGHSGDPIGPASTANRRGSRILPYALNGTSAIRPAAASRAFWGACSGSHAVSPSAPEPSFWRADAPHSLRPAVPVTAPG